MLFRPNLRHSVSRLCQSETGAVTVDWVVLCALVTGLTLAMSDEVGSALGFHSDNVTEELTNSEIVRAGDANTVGFEFSEGYAGRWSGAQVTDIPGFGEALGPIGGSDGYASVTHDFIMASNVDKSIIKFDLYGLDSLDDESGIIYIDGVEVGRVIVGHGGVTIESSNLANISFSGTVVATNVDLGGYRDTGEDGANWWKDDIISVSIEVTDPSDVMSFGFGSTANQSTDDESFAIDNFVISGVEVPSAEDAPET